MKLTLGFSPCPNDTFIFDALLHGKIDTEGLEFEPLLADVEELNQKAFRQDLDITKLSYHAYAFLLDRYVLLDAGSALGKNCGPLLIAKADVPKEDIPRLRIAIPGSLTTANFLLSLAYPEANDKIEMLFSKIEDAVLTEEVDAGLIIHENRFTYAKKGLVKLTDLCEFLENSTGHPIPLGGIAIRRDLALETKLQVNRVLSRSVTFAMGNPEGTYDFVRRYAQEMDREVMYKHIALYVNAFTRDLGTKGRQAVRQLFKMAARREIIPPPDKTIFLERKKALK